MIPRLADGDLVRVISFGLGLEGVSAAQQKICTSNLSKLGLRVSFGKHINVNESFDESIIRYRIEDLHDALRDPEVKLILSTLGGMSAAKILNYIDWDLVKENPKMFCGFSDMAVIANAIYAKTGLTTYYGPFYGTFGMEKGFEYTFDYFQRCLFSSESYDISPAPNWSDDFWWADQENRNMHANAGPIVVNEGVAEGRIIGGHLTSFAMLFGTKYMPDFSGSILVIEENSDINPRSFDRLLQFLIHQKVFPKAKALLIGRFTSLTQVTDNILLKILGNYPQLARIPVVANLSFGHTYPQATVPIGGRARIVATSNSAKLTVIRH